MSTADERASTLSSLRGRPLLVMLVDSMGAAAVRKGGDICGLSAISASLVAAALSAVS
jgi:hypothetical protein